MIFLRHVLLVCAALSTIRAEILIITHAYNRPEFIEWQVLLLKRFMLDEYRFVVFNDARDKQEYDCIREICKRMNIECRDIPQEIHDRPYLKRWPGEPWHSVNCRCANVVQYSLDTLGFDHDDIVMIIDSDLFPIKHLSIRSYLANHQIAGVPQNNGEARYLWNVFMLFDMPSLPDKKTINMNCGQVLENHVDVGGQLHWYFQAHPEVKILYVPTAHFGADSCIEKTMQDHSFTKNEQSFRTFVMSGPRNIDFIADGFFLHYRSGTNWDGKTKEFHQTKWNMCKLFFEGILQ